MLRPDYTAYFEHAMTLTPEEEELRAQLLPELPDTIIDSHTHSSAPVFNGFEMAPHILNHMMSTFPEVTIEQSGEIDKMFLPGKNISKLRFAHIYPGLDHKAVTEHILKNEGAGDQTALFGLSETPEDIEYTISELRSGKYAALKMYYMASQTPKYALFDYFPPEILAVAQEEQVPIILHLPHSLYRSQDEVDVLMERFPNLKVVLAHVGVANVPKPELNPILAAFAKHPNLYVDTALVDSDAIVFSALHNLGRNRILYGSDEPLNLMRVVTFFNPELQTARVLADYPYHWANPEEQSKWRHLADKPFVHNQWHQLGALVAAVRATATSPSNYEAIMEDIFAGNARSVFGF